MDVPAEQGGSGGAAAREGDMIELHPGRLLEGQGDPVDAPAGSRVPDRDHTGILLGASQELGQGLPWRVGPDLEHGGILDDVE
jgi:hypothetical protein